MKEVLLVLVLLVLLAFITHRTMFDIQCPPGYETVPGVTWAGWNYTCRPVGNDSTLVNTVPEPVRSSATCGQPAFILDM